MSIGGRVIELMPVTRWQGLTPQCLIRIWVVDRYGDESIIHIWSQPDVPDLGEEIWWQGNKVLWDEDRRTAVKCGYSSRPPL